MRDCLKVNGDNIEPLYHMGKACLRHGGMLPVVLTLDQKLVADAHNFLLESHEEEEDKKLPAISPTTIPAEADLHSASASDSDYVSCSASHYESDPSTN